MACYDCEDCIRHYEQGGKCVRWEYDCPFKHLDYMTENDKKLLIDLRTKLQELVKLQDRFEGDFDVDHIFGSINFAEMQINDLVDEDIVKEYDIIKGE